MPNDLQDLRGVFPTPLRWSAETGVLGYGVYDTTTGERTVAVIELNSPASKFIMDLDTRERGYALIREGMYDMRLTAVNSPPPPWPDDEEFKPAIGCWLWNPAIGEVRLETNGAIFRTAISALWDHCRTFKELAEGLQPVVHFVGRRERTITTFRKTYWVPIIDVIGWVARDKVPSFAGREATVKPPLAIDSQVKQSLLEHQHRAEPVRARAKAKPSAVLQRGALDELLDDEIPEL